MSNKNEKNKPDRENRENYDRRPIVDPPTSGSGDDKSHISSKRKGFYIILLLGITAIGMYAVLSSVMSDRTANVQDEVRTASYYATPRPASVPVTAAVTPVPDEPESTPAPQTNAPVPTAAPAAEPGQAPVSGKIIKDFSLDDLIYSATMDDWRTHSGVDIAASLDTPVTAVKDGTLKKVYEDSLLGTTVIIHHPSDGTDSVYCNLKDVTNDPIGTELKTGDMIGRIGSTAVSELSDEPHLHFEIRLDDESLDPKEFVKFEDAEYLSPSEAAVPSAEPSASSDPYTDENGVETMIID